MLLGYSLTDNDGDEARELLNGSIVLLTHVQALFEMVEKC